MKKFFLIAILGIISLALCAQYSPKHQPFEMQMIQASAPLKSTQFTERQPLSKASPTFEFDSLNVTYQGSWGFGQTFSISSDSSGGILFIGSGAGVIILDVTDLSAPVKLSEISTRGLVDAIYFDELTERLYLCAYFAGFEIWDVADMANPVKIGGGSTTGLPRGGIFATGNYVYVVTVADGIQIYDVTDPSNPVNVGNCILDPNDQCWNADKQGNLIYAALWGGMKVVDVSNPANPVIAGFYNVNARDVDVRNELAYIVSFGNQMHILDISNLSNITEISSLSLPGYPGSVRVQDNYAYVANSTSGTGGGMNVVDVSDSATPNLVAIFPGYAEFITVGGPMAAFSAGALCTILDITGPTTPELGTLYDIPVFMNDIEVSGSLAYTGNNGFRVFDISDKTNPVQIGYDSTDGAIVRLSGDKAVYIRESMTSLNPVMVMDISDPTQPSLLGQYMSPVMTNDLEIKDHYAFVACWWDGFRVVDFQDPAHPVLVAHEMGWFNGAVPGVDFSYVQALDIEGNYLYLVDYGPFMPGEDTYGLYIFDITDPENPVFITRFLECYGGYDIDASGDFVYVADNNGGLRVIDVTEKNAPISRGYVGLPDGANSVKVTENHAFVADYINGGLQVVNVTDPEILYVDGYYAPTGCFALGVNVYGNDVYVADGAGGFQIYETTLITGTGEKHQRAQGSSSAYPDPFTEQVSIRVEGSANTPLKVYDASGRLVMILSSAEKSGNLLYYKWDGSTFSASEANAGFYYYSNGEVSGKMIKR